MHRRDIRMQVLGVLRTHSANGAEVPASILSLTLGSSGAVATALVGLGSAHGWAAPLIALLTAFFLLRGVRDLSAAHIRRLTSLAWLAALEDGLAEHRASLHQPKRERRRSRKLPRQFRRN